MQSMLRIFESKDNDNSIKTFNNKNTSPQFRYGGKISNNNNSKNNLGAIPKEYSQNNNQSKRQFNDQSNRQFNNHSNRQFNDQSNRQFNNQSSRLKISKFSFQMNQILLLTNKSFKTCQIHILK